MFRALPTPHRLTILAIVSLGERHTTKAYYLTLPLDVCVRRARPAPKRMRGICMVRYCTAVYRVE